MCVEAGREKRVKKDILRRVRLAGLTGDVRRVIVPTEVREVVGYGVKGEVLAAGEAESFHACRSLADEALLNYDGDHLEFKVKFRKCPARPGWYTFTLRERNAKPVRRLVRVPKYPGYVVLQLNYTPAVSRVVDNTRDAFGLLIRPLHAAHKVEVAYSKRRGGWAWKVLTGGREVVASGVEAGKVLARTKARQALATAEEFRPTPLADLEAAELLMRERAMDRKGGTSSPPVDVAVGDTVVVGGDGAWTGWEVVAEAVAGGGVAGTVTVMGVPVKINIPFSEVRKK